MESVGLEFDKRQGLLSCYIAATLEVVQSFGAQESGSSVDSVRRDFPSTRLN